MIFQQGQLWYHGVDERFYLVLSCELDVAACKQYLKHDCIVIDKDGISFRSLYETDHHTTLDRTKNGLERLA